MRRLSSLGALVVILAVVAGFALLLHAHSGSGPASSPTSIATTVTLPRRHTDCVIGNSTVQPIGLPAIKPHLCGVPAFTRADVIAFIEHSPDHGVFAAHVQGNVTITTVAFITAAQASQLMQGESIGVPDDAIVCYVALSGSFVNDRVPPGVTPRPASHAVLVFDGTTGNILVEGVG